VRIVVVPDSHAAAVDAAGRIARRLRDAVRSRGSASLALSGGSTPRPMHEALAGIDLPWDLVHVYQVDERVAPDGHPDRNLGGLAALPAGHVHPMPVTSARLTDAARRYSRALPDMIAVTGEFNGRRRMTLTPVAVNGARWRLVLVLGASRAAPVARWLGGDRTLPVQRVRRQGTLLVLDVAAAADLHAAHR
jgi:6-phosphogluconolactonase/glucosamine-6-phosphate isomerase/deaminase